MRYCSQRTVTSANVRIENSDDSVYLRGNTSQTVSIDGSGAGAASPGASFRLINDSDHDANFVPGVPQTVSRGALLVVPAHSGVTLELSPTGDWVKV